MSTAESELTFIQQPIVSLKDAEVSERTRALIAIWRSRNNYWKKGFAE